MAKHPTVVAQIQQAAQQIKMLAKMPAYRRPNGQRRLTFYLKVADIIIPLNQYARSVTQGGNIFEDLGAALKDLNLGQDTLYKAVRFAKAVQTGKVDAIELERQSFNWRDVSRLKSSQSKENAKRVKLLTRLKAGKIKPDKLGKRLARLASPIRGTNKRSLEAAHTRATKGIRHLQRAKTQKQWKELAEGLLKEIRQLLDKPT
jgi:hypothetical protein